MVIALNKTVNRHLSKQFQQRSVKKKYIALLTGQLVCSEGIINAAIAKDPTNFPLMQVCDDTGKASETLYKVLEYDLQADQTRVLFQPQTGRTHQLRIHSRELGHPIIGCDLYGNACSKKAGNRLMLHASYLEFIHPLTQQPFVISSRCPF